MGDSAALNRSRNKSPSLRAAHHGSNLPPSNTGVSCFDVLQLHAVWHREALIQTHAGPTQNTRDACRCNLDSGPNDRPQTLGMLDMVIGYGRWNLPDHHG